MSISSLSEFGFCEHVRPPAIFHPPLAKKGTYENYLRSLYCPSHNYCYPAGRRSSDRVSLATTCFLEALAVTGILRVHSYRKIAIGAATCGMILTIFRFVSPYFFTSCRTKTFCRVDTPLDEKSSTDSTKWNFDWEKIEKAGAFTITQNTCKTCRALIPHFVKHTNRRIKLEQFQWRQLAIVSIGTLALQIFNVNPLAPIPKVHQSRVAWVVSAAFLVSFIAMFFKQRSLTKLSPEHLRSIKELADIKYPGVKTKLTRDTILISASQEDPE